MDTDDLLHKGNIAMQKAEQAQKEAKNLRDENKRLIQNIKDGKS